MAVRFEKPAEPVKEFTIGKVNALTQTAVDMKKPYEILGANGQPTIMVQEGKCYVLGKWLLVGNFTEEIAKKYNVKVEPVKKEVAAVAAVAPAVSTETVDPTGFPCDICGKSYKSKAALKAHKTRSH